MRFVLAIGAVLLLLSTTSAVAGKSPTPTDAPIDDVAARSDLFWRRLRQGGDRPGVGESIADIVGASTVIVLGRPRGFRDHQIPQEDGYGFNPRPTLLLSITVDEVLKGTPQSESCGVIDLLVDEPFDLTLEEATALMPMDEQSLFLLWNLAERNELVDAPAAEIEATRTVYIWIIDEQGVIRDVQGTAHALVPIRDDEIFPGMFEGGPFNDVQAAVRDEIASQGSPAPSPATSATPSAC